MLHTSGTRSKLSLSRHTTFKPCVTPNSKACTWCATLALCILELFRQLQLVPGGRIALLCSGTVFRSTPKSSSQKKSIRQEDRLQIFSGAHSRMHLRRRSLTALRCRFETALPFGEAYDVKSPSILKLTHGRGSPSGRAVPLVWSITGVEFRAPLQSAHLRAHSSVRDLPFILVQLATSSSWHKESMRESLRFKRKTFVSGNSHPSLQKRTSPEATHRLKLP